MSLERKARAYIAAVEGGATGDELAAFYHPDVVQHEFPNRLVPTARIVNSPTSSTGPSAAKS